LKHREELRSLVEDLINKLDEQYQEKNSWVKDLDREIAAKASALTEATATLANNQSLLETRVQKVARIKSISEIETGKTLLGGKVTLSKEDYGTLSNLAKKQIVAENQEYFLKRCIITLEAEKKSLSSEKERLTEQVTELKEENGRLQSVNGKIAVATLRSERDNLQRKLDRIMEFIKSLGLAERLQAFLKPRGREIHK